MTLKYYQDEALRQPTAHSTRCSPTEARVALMRLAVRYKVPLRRIRFTRGNRISKAIGTHTIVLNQECLNWLLVAHEFAHCLHTELRLRKNRKGIVLRPERHHNARHARLTDRCVAYMVKHGWLAGYLRNQILTKQAAQEERQRLRAMPPTRDQKIKRRLDQVARLERRIKALTTRLRTARRSLGALQRAATRKGET